VLHCVVELSGIPASVGLTHLSSNAAVAIILEHNFDIELEDSGHGTLSPIITIAICSIRNFII